MRVDIGRQAFGRRELTRRIARTVFLGSAATLKSAHKGVEQQRIWLGVAVPGDTVGNFGSALHVLSDQTTYLYVDGARYWYDTQASVTRTAKDYAERLHEEDAWAEITRRLRTHEQRVRGDFASVHPAPDGTAGIPDTEEARLVILYPRVSHNRGATDSTALAFARTALDARGSAQRANRNMLVFLAPDAKRLEELEEATREYLSWNHISGRIEELNLSPQQAKQVETRLRNADGAAAARIAQAYIWALVPAQPDPARPVTWDVVKAEGSKERLAERASDKLRQSDLIRTVQNSRVIRQDLNQQLSRAWERGHIGVGELWGYYCRYPYLARLRDRSVLDAGVLGVLDELTWEIEGFALAAGHDEATGRYTGLAIPHEDNTFGQVVDTTLLVRPDLAKRQREQERVTAAQAAAESAGVIAEPEPAGGSGVFVVRPAEPEPPAKPEPANRRFFGVYRVNPDRYGRDFGRIAQEVLPHLAVEGAELEITVEVTARKPDGFGDDRVRTVTENARTLKFDQFGFEND